MHSLQRVSTRVRGFTPTLSNPNSISDVLFKSFFSTRSTKNGGEEWNDAWETAWLPEDLTAKSRAPWEADVNFGSQSRSTETVLAAEADGETKAFVEEMNENWEERRKTTKMAQKGESSGGDVGLYSLENLKKDYRLKKQSIHAGLWAKEIEKQQEAKLGGSAAADDIDRLLDSCSEIFDTANDDVDNSKIPGSSEFKNIKDTRWKYMGDVTA